MGRGRRNLVMIIPTTLVTVFGKFSHTSFSMRKIGAMVSCLDPKDLADQGFQALPFHW